MIKETPFGDFEKYQEEVALRVRFLRVLQALSSTIAKQHPGDADSLLRFANCLDSAPDTYPVFQYTAPKAQRGRKRACVLALVQHACFLWSGGSDHGKFEKVLDQLEEIDGRGLDAFVLEGDRIKGYELEKK
ncbi:MAG TPA: hypothetical protein VMW50_08305 [Dehalococcoidia bacterium]|nr:hypothetical protein [Dehalococcoidia bacterium]